MNAIDPSGAAGFLARYDGLKDRLPGDRQTRATAADELRRIGLPGPRVEAWKYTNLRPLAQAAFHEPMSPVGDHQVLACVPRLAPARLTFVSGHYRPDLSEPPEGAFATFAERPELASLGEEHPFVALNTMLAEDGLVLDVPAGADLGAIQLASLAEPVPGRVIAFHPRHVIRLGAGSRLVLIETVQGEGDYLHNAVFDVRVGEGAELTVLRLQDESPTAFHVSTSIVELAERARFDSFVLGLGGRLARAEVHVRMGGAGATAHVGGAQLLSGNQLGDITTVIRHDAPRCASRQPVKNVLTGRARGVFQGRIEVARAAQKTDGYQMSQALLLSPDAEIDTKPELEIFADDVKCSHGATVGELDADQLFYLRSRGISEPDARAILVRAFLAEALEVVTHEATRAAMGSAVERWWERQAA